MRKRYKNLEFAINSQNHGNEHWQFNFLPTIYFQNCNWSSSYRWTIQFCFLYWAAGVALRKKGWQ